jgi:arsenate reductase
MEKLGERDPRSLEVYLMMKTYNVLFLCTGNSARSIMAEALLRRWGGNRFQAFSAGSFPKGVVHPLAIKVLKRLDIPADGLSSKSWNEFTKPGSPPMDLIFTVCDQAAGEVCPVWPGRPMMVHWGVEDPAAVEGTEDERLTAFERVLGEMDRRVKLLATLRVEAYEPACLKEELERIGQTGAMPLVQSHPL